ncbi:MAG: hypothetical protein AAFR84_06505 [Pseudomonadota bacterium]
MAEALGHPRDPLAPVALNVAYLPHGERPPGPIIAWQLARKSKHSGHWRVTRRGRELLARHVAVFDTRQGIPASSPASLQLEELLTDTAAALFLEAAKSHEQLPETCMSVLRVALERAREIGARQQSLPVRPDEKLARL